MAVNAFLLFVMFLGHPGIDSGKPIIRNDPCSIPAAPVQDSRRGRPIIRN